MKPRLLILLILVWACVALKVFGQSTSTVNFNLTDARFQTVNFANRTIWIQYLSAPSSYGGSTINYSKIITNSDVNGNFTMALVPGLYSMAIQAPPDSSTSYFVVLQAGQTINAGDYIVLKTSNQYVWPNTLNKLTSSNGTVTLYPANGIGVVDLNASGAAPLAAGSNVTIVQVGGTNIISASGGGGQGVTNNQFLPGDPGVGPSSTNGSFSGIYVQSQNANVNGAGPNASLAGWQQTNSLSTSNVFPAQQVIYNIPKFLINPIFITNNSTTLFVATNGNDGTGVRGDPQHPYLTLVGALNSFTPNDRLLMGPGVFTVNQRLDLPANLYLQGSGEGVTSLQYIPRTNYDYGVSLKSNDRLEDFTLTQQTTNASGAPFIIIYPLVTYPFTNGSAPNQIGPWTQVTNVIVRNVEIINASDTMSINGDSIVYFYQCRFFSKWDCLTTKWYYSGMPLGKIAIWDSIFLSSLNGNSDTTNIVNGMGSTGDLSCIFLGNSPSYVECHNCTMITTNSQQGAANSTGYNAPVVNATVVAGSAVYLEDCALFNEPNWTNNSNLPGQQSYYLIQGPGVYVKGHPYPDDRCYQTTFLDSSSFFKYSGATGGTAANVHTLYYTNNARNNMGIPGWTSPNSADAIAAQNLMADTLVLDNNTGGILDSLGNNRIIINGNNTSIYGANGTQPLEVYQIGDVRILGRITNGAPNIIAKSALWADQNKVITSIPNAIGQLNNDGSGNLSWSSSGGGAATNAIVTVASNSVSIVSPSTNLDFWAHNDIVFGLTNTSSGTADVGIGVNPSLTNIAIIGLTNASKITATTQGNTNTLEIVNPSGQTVAAFGTNGTVNLGTNNDFRGDTSGNWSINGQFVGSGAGLGLGTIPISSLAPIASLTTLGNVTGSSIQPGANNTATIMDAGGSTVHGLLLRAAGPNWTNSILDPDYGMLYGLQATNYVYTLTEVVTNTIFVGGGIQITGGSPGLSISNTLGAGGDNAIYGTNAFIQLSNAENNIVFMMGTNMLQITNKALTVGSQMGAHGYTNSAWAVNAPLLTDANKGTRTLAAASGALTNDGSGNIGWLAGIGGGSGTGIQTNGGTGVNNLFSNTTVRTLSWTNKAFGDSLTITNAQTNLNITANSVVVTDGSQALTNLVNGGNNTVLHGTTPPAFSSIVAADLPMLLSAYPQAITNGDNRAGGVTLSNGLQVIGDILQTNGWLRQTNAVVGARMFLSPTNFVMSNSVAHVILTNGHLSFTNYGAANQNIDIDPTTGINLGMAASDNAVLGISANMRSNSTDNIVYRGQPRYNEFTNKASTLGSQWGPSGFSNSAWASGQLLGVDANKGTTPITVGANLTLSGGTLSASGGGGAGLPGTNTVIAYGGDPATASQTNWSAEIKGQWYETNKAGGYVIASNGVVEASTGIYTGASGTNYFGGTFVGVGGTNYVSYLTVGALNVMNYMTATNVFITNNFTLTNISGNNLTWTNNTLLTTNNVAAGNNWFLLSADYMSMSNGTQKSTVSITSSNAAWNAGAMMGSIALRDVNSNAVWQISNYIFFTTNVTVNVTNGCLLITNTVAANQGTTYGSSGITNAPGVGANIFNYMNLKLSTNCASGFLTNGVANSTQTLLGYEEVVVSMGNTIVQLGDATTNYGHKVFITCGSSGTNAITTVSSQKIAGLTKWTNTAIFTCTQLISDGSNWQICGSRGN